MIARPTGSASRLGALRASRLGTRGRAAIVLTSLLGVAAGIGACGTQGIQIPKSSPYYKGAVLFLDHCSGCHTLAVVGAEGSATASRTV